MSNRRTTILKVTISKNIVGLMTITESQAIYSGGYFGSIDEMYVEHGFRNQKIGEQLIKKAIEIAKEKKWNRCYSSNR